MTRARPASLAIAGAAIQAACACEPAPDAPAEHGEHAALAAAERERMVSGQIEARGVRDPRVLAALRAVPRHEFVPAELRADAYSDRPLPIGDGQTISQPYIVAFMTEAAALEPDDRVLEIGTGSGYQAAVLSELCREVFTIELLPALAASAAARLAAMERENVFVRQGDGYLGWPEKAPFDAIVVTCGAEHVPQPLVDQLAPGARMVIPVGPQDDQRLRIVEKDAAGRVSSRDEFPVRFVPLRRAGESDRR